MNRAQQQATRELERAQENWLLAYGWRPVQRNRWQHPREAKTYTLADAMLLTRAEPLLFGAA